jgi:phosphatidylserine decarboxylase
VISKYGVDVVLKSFVVIILIAGCAWMFIDVVLLKYGILGIDAVVAILVLNFFRDPERHTPGGDTVVVSPADGRVVIIKELFESQYLKGNAVQISIFMSPLNVHVNRFPINGTVGYFEHIQGEYIVAFDEKSSERNERTLIGVEREGYKVLFKQIAGAVARRIVAPVKLGQRAVCGERFGMIKFGSRVDVILPRSSEIKVKLDEHVVAGETILASFEHAGTSR